MPLLLLLLLLTLTLAAGGPQTSLLYSNCSPYNATIPSFSSSLNSSFINLRSQLDRRLRQRHRRRLLPLLLPPLPLLPRLPLLLLRRRLHSPLLPPSQRRPCRFRRLLPPLQNHPFLHPNLNERKMEVCGNSSEKLGFGGDVEDLLRDLSLATPRIDGYFAVARRGRIYAVAQCAITVSVGGCGDCLTTAYANAKQCLPETEGRAVDAGCFMRYSFFWEVSYCGS